MLAALLTVQLAPSTLVATLGGRDTQLGDKSVRKPKMVLAWGSILLFASATCGLVPSRAVAGQVTIADYSDGYAESPTGNGTYSVLNTTGTTLVIRQFTNLFEDRGLANFNLSALPANAVITSVSLQYNDTLVTTNPG
jgi:hypothetical protein